MITNHNCNVSLDKPRVEIDNSVSHMDEIFLPHLRAIEPHAQFTFKLPIIESSLGRKYYAKVGSFSEREQFVGEAESLRAIHNAAPGLAPQVFAAIDPSTAASEQPYFLSEYRNTQVSLQIPKQERSLAEGWPWSCMRIRAPRDLGFMSLHFVEQLNNRMAGIRVGKNATAL